MVSNASASKLTPKQLQQKLEAENRLKEKLRLKEERERKAAEELERKKKEREEKEEQRRQEKEEKEKEREEKKRKEREDREKKRLEEIEAKTEDRKRKEEQREQERKRKEEQKEEERKKKEEEKTAKEEADKEKNRKKAEAFTKFFVKSTPKPVGSTPVVDHTEVECRMNFMPFRVKEDMKLAPMVRRVFSDNHRRNFDSKVLSSHSTSKNEDLYVNQLKTGFTKPGRSGKTWVNNDSDVLIVGMFLCVLGCYYLQIILLFPLQMMNSKVQRLLSMNPKSNRNSEPNFSNSTRTVDQPIMVPGEKQVPPSLPVDHLAKMW